MEIAAAMQKEMDERAAVVSRSRTVVPNDFDVHLAPEGLRTAVCLPDTLTTELAGMACEHATEQRYPSSDRSP